MSRKRKDVKQNKDIKYTSLKTNYENSRNVEEEPMVDRPLLEDYQMCMVTGVLLLGVYVSSLHPSVPGGDSGELIIAAHELGVPHPPGYPLFTLLGKAAMVLVRYGSPAWRVNLLNAALSATAGGLLQMCVLKLTRDMGTSLLAVGLFCVNSLTWTWAVTAEVFGLNNCLLAAIMLTCIEFEFSLERDDTQREEQNTYSVKLCLLGVMLCGLSLCNQHTAVFYVIPVALWVLVALYKNRLLTLRLLVCIAVVFALSLLPYLYLPLSSAVNGARWTWGDQTNIQGLLRHVLRTEYGTFSLGKDTDGQGFVTGITAYFEHTYSSLRNVGPFLAVIGAIASVTIRHRDGERSLFVFIVMLSGYVMFFAWRANLDVLDPLYRGVVERFWMQSDLVVVLLAAVGYHPVVKWLTKKVLGSDKQSMMAVFTMIGGVCFLAPGQWLTEKVLGSDKQSMTAVFTMIGGVCVLALNLQNFQACNQSKNFVVRDFAATLLKNMPQNAIVLTKGDLPTNSMRYLHLCEGVRPDVSLIDVEILTYQWSLPKLRKFYPKVDFPGDFWHNRAALWENGKRSFTMETFLNANYNKYPIFACIGMTDRDLSWSRDYDLWPYGPCHAVVTRATPMQPAEWANSTQDYAQNWKYPLDSFADSSWEKVANDEMWNAKISSAFYMYSNSEKAPDAKTKTDFLLAAYESYFSAIKKNQVSGRLTFTVMYPSYWHKNFALVCERLLYVDTHHSKSQLCKSSVYHFEQYIAAITTANRKLHNNQHSHDNDPELDSIREAVKSLRSRIDTYEKLDQVQRTFKPKV